MSSTGYITYPITADARDLMQRAFDYLGVKVPGWTPAEGNLDVWMIEAFGNEAADIQTLATEVPKSLFRYMGSKLFGIQPINAVAATCTSTWTLTDSNGHTIPAGTQVSINDAAGNPNPFTVLFDVIVPGGSNATPAGAVSLMASNPGAAASGIGSAGGSVNLIDPLAWVNTITQVAVTAGGIDAETDDAYLDRLSNELQAMSPRPILASDFAILAENVAGVQRSMAIDGYNPGDGTSNNQRMVTVYSLDSTGSPVSAGVKTNVQAYLQSMREINFIVNVDDPVKREIDVTTAVVMNVGYQAADIINRVQQAIINFLNPATWGISPSDNPNDPITWINTPTINRLELASAITTVVGVNVINTLTLGAHGGAQSAADYLMPGKAPVPFTQVADLTVTAS
jgi:uncharacterized phage protein gp47/JayE